MPDTPETEAIARRAFDARGHATEMSMQDLYRIARVPGCHVLSTKGRSDVSVILEMNRRGIGGWPVIVPNGGPATAADIEYDTQSALAALLTTKTIKNAVVIIFGPTTDPILGSSLERAMKKGTVRTVVCCTATLPADVAWLGRLCAISGIYYPDKKSSSFVAMPNRGSAADISALLRWTWSVNAKVAPYAPTARACLAWASTVSERVAPTQCPICLEEPGPDDERAVMACCSAQYCFECTRHWVGLHATCPTCRRPCDTSTVHVIVGIKGGTGTYL